jgi:hypothetical protein
MLRSVSPTDREVGWWIQPVVLCDPLISRQLQWLIQSLSFLRGLEWFGSFCFFPSPLSLALAQLYSSVGADNVMSSIATQVNPCSSQERLGNQLPSRSSS